MWAFLVKYYFFSRNNKKQSRVDISESSSQLDSIKESPATEEVKERLVIQTQPKTAKSRQTTCQKNANLQQENENLQTEEASACQEIIQTAEKGKGDRVTCNIAKHHLGKIDEKLAENSSEITEDCSELKDADETEPSRSSLDRIVEANKENHQPTSDKDDGADASSTLELDMKKLSDEYRLKDCSIRLGVPAPAKANDVLVKSVTTEQV